MASTVRVCSLDRGSRFKTCPPWKLCTLIGSGQDRGNDVYIWGEPGRNTSQRGAAVDWCCGDIVIIICESGRIGFGFCNGSGPRFRSLKHFKQLTFWMSHGWKLRIIFIIKARKLAMYVCTLSALPCKCILSVVL